MARIRVLYRVLCCRKYSVVFLCFAVLYIFHVVWLLWGEESCSLEQSIVNVKLLCEEYREGHLTGSLCPYLCNSEEINLQKCMNYAGGKEIYLTSWRGKNLIMKSKKPSWHDYQRFMPNGVPAHEANVTVLLHFMSETIKDTFNVKLDLTFELLHNFWFLSNNGFSLDSKKRLAVMESVWSLFQQDEYVTIMFLKKSKFMPLLYGTCGHYYFMEFLPSGKLLSAKNWLYRLLQQDSISWKSQVVLSLYLLELIRSLDSGFNDIIHICDLKGDNFGLSPDGAVKVIDVDMLLSDTKLKRIYDGFQCETDTDCDFFDCKAKCDVGKHTCIATRSNTNLQVLCEQIFRSHLQNGFHGLLDNPPASIAHDLNQLLDGCINTTDPNFVEILYKFLNTHLYSYLLPQHSDEQ